MTAFVGASIVIFGVFSAVFAHAGDITFSNHTPYSLPREVEIEVERTMMIGRGSRCYLYGLPMYSWTAGVSLVPNTSYTYDVKMSATDWDSPSRIVEASLKVKYDATTRKTEPFDVCCSSYCSPVRR